MKINHMRRSFPLGLSLLIGAGLFIIGTMYFLSGTTIAKAEQTKFQLRTESARSVSNVGLAINYRDGGDGSSGGDGGGGDGSGGGNPPPPNAPTCTISSNAANKTLSWTSTDASSAYIDNGIGYVGVNGFLQVFPSITTTYTLTVSGAGGVATCATTMTVVPPAPSCSINSYASDTGFQLTWSSSNATSASLNQGIGAVAVNGTRFVSPSVTTTYTLTVSGAGGTATCSTTVTVIPPSAPYCSISAAAEGSGFRLTWTSANATSATLNQSIGNVAVNGNIFITPSVTTTYTLTVTGAGGTANCSTTIVVTPPAPSCTMSNNGSSISWTSVNATSASINRGIGSVALNGNMSVFPTVTTTYTLTVTGAGGTATCSTTVVVNPTAPSCTMSNNGTSITWTSANATSASIDQGIGSVGLNGSRNVSPAVTTTYTLTVNGAGGTATCSTTIVKDVAPPSCTLTVTPSTVQEGQSTILAWTTSNAVSAVLSGGGGSVAIGGGSFPVTPAFSTDYAMTVTNAAGVTATCTAQVTVIPKTNTPSCSINANPANIQTGASSVLTWTSSNATSASINQGIGSVAVNGNKSVSPYATTLYTLTVTGAGGTATCSTTVTVNSVTPPSCSMSNDGYSISWNSSNATSASIDQGIGSVGLNGSRNVSPAVTTTYTLTVNGAGGTATCSTTVVKNTAGPSCTLTVTPSTVQEGSQTILAWTTTNAVSAVLSGGGGSVPVTGGSFPITPAFSTDYAMTVTNSVGVTATCTAHVTVVPKTNQLSCSISANPSQIQQGGSSTLTWTSSGGATTATISGIGSVSVNGSKSVSPWSDTTYVLTIGDAYGHSATCSTMVSVGVATHPKMNCYLPGEMRTYTAEEKATLISNVTLGLRNWVTYMNSHGYSWDPLIEVTVDAL